MHLNPGKFAEVTFFPFSIWIATCPSALKPFGQLGSQIDPSLVFLFMPVVSHPLVKLCGFLKTVLTFVAFVQYLCIILFDGALYPATAYSPREKQFLVAELILVT